MKLRPRLRLSIKADLLLFLRPRLQADVRSRSARVLHNGPKGMGAAVRMVYPLCLAGRHPLPLHILHPSRSAAIRASLRRRDDIDHAGRRHDVRFLRRRIEQGLRATPGVVNASVNLATEKARVDYLPARRIPPPLPTPFDRSAMHPCSNAPPIPTTMKRAQPVKNAATRFLDGCESSDRTRHGPGNG